MAGKTYQGYTIVTRSMLQVRDYTVYPPDRTLIKYKILRDSVATDVLGSWGDYLRDVDNNIVIKETTPLTKEEAQADNNAMVIGDVADVDGTAVAPDRPFMVDPTRSFA